MRITTLKATGLAAALAASLAACGGDDLGRPAPPAGPGPSFGQNALEFTYVEGGTGPVGTLVLNAADTSDITFVLTGADANLFEISSTGELRFRNPPSFASPTDAGGNNVYNLTVTASDRGANVSTVAITITVIANATAVRFVDQVFAAAEPRGTITLTGASANLPVTLLVPASDTWPAPPMVVVGGEDPATLAAIAADFARRGYGVASVPSGDVADLQAITLALRGNAVGGIGMDTSALSVAGTGGAADTAALTQAFADSAIASFALAANQPVADAARHFHEHLTQGGN